MHLLMAATEVSFLPVSADLSSVVTVRIDVPLLVNSIADLRQARQPDVKPLRMTSLRPATSCLPLYDDPRVGN